MAATDIEVLLAARLGFDAQTVGPSAVANAIRKAMDESGVTDVAAYAQRVVHDGEVWETLVDRIVVPETSFFRDAVPFELVPELAYARRQREPGRILRVLSCPCSSGEEAYSLALALLDGGAPPDSFVVHAVDVSRRAVHAARAARYPANSFRGADLSYRERYFHPAGASAWQLHDSARSLVRVQQANILAPDFLRDEAPFDVVFCRNLMIYLHAQAKTAVLTAVRRLLASDGVLVVGHAEAAITREHGFTAMGRAGAFAFTPGGARRAVTPARFSRPVAALVPAPETAGAREGREGIVRPFVRVAAAARVDPESLLAKANELADAGHLEEALRVCTAHLERLPDSADGHFLMGVLHDAMGEWRLAAVALKKSLYLDTGHLTALQHLALKREAAGDRDGAALLRARARRASELAGGESR